MRYDPNHGLSARLALDIVHSYDLPLQDHKDAIRTSILNARARNGHDGRPALDYFDDYMATLAHKWH